MFLIPTNDSFIENLHIAITVFVENAISQTGQVMGARSIEYHEPVVRDAFQIFFELRQRRGLRAQYVYLVELFFRSHIDQHGLGTGFDVINQLIDADKLWRDIGRQSLLGKFWVF